MTDPYLLALIAFIAGTAFGWLLATSRARGATTDFTSAAGSVAGVARARMVKARTMEMKCACGTVSRFRDPVEPGFQPFPDGDTIACSNCGRVTNLNQIRKMERDAGG
jgi:hypothetical protein